MKLLQVTIIILLTVYVSWAADGYTQADRERDIRTETTLQEFMKSTDRRFEDMNKRFEDMNKRFEDMNNRLLDMNNRQQDTTQLLYIIISLFATVVGGLFIYIVWDRKTFLAASLQNARIMVDEKLIQAQKDSKLTDLINAMRDMANDDPKIKTILSRYNLL
ncbi:MAG: hypothetical protein NW207_08940 [Cytophagales bacterium]|nr:hypothetical protein [Cytophagales bacterium]